jgi:hypothetical protein
MEFFKVFLPVRPRDKNMRKIRHFAPKIRGHLAEMAAADYTEQEKQRGRTGRFPEFLVQTPGCGRGSAAGRPPEEAIL